MCGAGGRREETGVVTTRCLAPSSLAMHCVPCAWACCAWCTDHSPTRAAAAPLVSQALRLLVEAYRQVQSPDWVLVCRTLAALDDMDGVAEVVGNLLTGPEVRG